MLHRLEQPATRTVSCLYAEASVLVVMTIRMGSNSNACQSNTATRDYDSIDKEFEISCRCLDKESEDRQNHPCTENMGKTM